MLQQLDGDPEAVNIALGNFVFLRFINPAVASPEGFGLTESIFL